jgi:hypothetical protein
LSSGENDAGGRRAQKINHDSGLDPLSPNHYSRPAMLKINSQVVILVVVVGNDAAGAC